MFPSRFLTILFFCMACVSGSLASAQSSADSQDPNRAKVVCRDFAELGASLDRRSWKRRFAISWLLPDSSCSAVHFILADSEGPSRLALETRLDHFVGIYDSSASGLVPIYELKLPETEEVVLWADLRKNFHRSDWQVIQRDGIDVLSPLKCAELRTLYLDYYITQRSPTRTNLPVFVDIRPDCNGYALSDAKYITDALISADIQARLTDHISALYVEAFATALAEKSIQIKNADAFAQLIPQSIIDQTLRELEYALLNRILNLNDAQLYDVASNIGTMRADGTVSQVNGTTHDDTVMAVFDTHTAKFSDAFGGHRHLAAMGLGQSAAAFLHNLDVSVDLREPYLIDILETPGVVRFPNLVLKKELVEDIRSTSLP